IGALIIGEYPEAAAVMLFYQVGEFFQEMAIRRSKKSIAALMDIRPDFANLKTGSEIIKVDPARINVGDIIIVKPGEKIPLDGEVVEGESMLDTRALTGESVPRRAKPADAVLSGCINLNGALTIKTTKSYGQSTVAKIIDLVENASNKKAPTENFITSFARYYTPVVVGLAALIAVIPPLLGFGEWGDWIHRALVFLVISCPCALVISIPLGFFGGIGGASRKGILVKGGNYLEALAKLDIVVFDKTGTLTKGVFSVTGIQCANGFSDGQVLEYAAKAEAFSAHPIAASIMAAYGKEITLHDLSACNEIAGYGVSVNAGGKTILAGNERLMARNGVMMHGMPDSDADCAGARVYVAVDNTIAGRISISDDLKPDSKAAIAEIKKRGIRKTVILTGDNPHIASKVADALNIDEYYAGLLPGEKVEKLELLAGEKRAKGKLAFVGDGINDAPVLARADVGIAMGAFGSDAAIEAADVVLMTDEPSKIAQAIDIARFTRKIVWQNIVAALGIKGVFLVLGALGAASMWEAVFADVGVALLATLNAARVIRAK
ncbi:MAG: cadmium-translocating P-type ATPase, partial [Treponema sp.]|nr:cadmium-translocating P-type ATPase [Treponema sp.]